MISIVQGFAGSGLVTGGVGALLSSAAPAPAPVASAAPTYAVFAPGGPPLVIYDHEAVLRDRRLKEWREAQAKAQQQQQPPPSPQQQQQQQQTRRYVFQPVQPPPQQQQQQQQRQRQQAPTRTLPPPPASPAPQRRAAPPLVQAAVAIDRAGSVAAALPALQGIAAVWITQKWTRAVLSSLIEAAVKPNPRKPK